MSECANEGWILVLTCGGWRVEEFCVACQGVSWQGYGSSRILEKQLAKGNGNAFEGSWLIQV